MLSFPEIHFLRPEWLWLLLPTAVGIGLLLIKTTRSNQWSDVIAPDLLDHLLPNNAQSRQRGPWLWLGLAWLSGIIAASGPSWQQTPVPVSQQKSAYVIVLDLSYSMYAEDLSPSRLVRATQKIRDLLALQQDTQVGLIAYAGDAHVVTPLTDDLATIENLVPALVPSIMPVPGSSPEAAFALARDLLNSSGVPGGGILWITDDIETDQAESLVSELSTADLAVTILGVGTQSGAPIPLGNGGFLRDAANNIVVPSLPQKRLEQLAADLGGHFSLLTFDDSDINTALDRLSQTDQRSQIIVERQADTWADAGHWWLVPWLIAIFALILKNPSALLALIIVAVPLGLAPQHVIAQAPKETPPQSSRSLWQQLWQTPNQQAAKLLETDPKAAAALFDDPAWAAIASYQANDSVTALEQFEALPGETASDWYNLGNARAKAGQLEEALAAFDQSLALEPSDDAQFNRDLVAQLLQQQDQSETEQQGDGSQSDDSQNSESSSSKGQESESSDTSESNSEASSDPSDTDQNSDQQSGASDPSEQKSDPQTAPPASETDASAEGSESDSEAAEAEQALAQQTINDARADQEKQQAMEQWIRRIEDDPSGLLREKFRYESEQRQRQNTTQNGQKVW